jgi:hypothetical protein
MQPGFVTGAAERPPTGVGLGAGLLSLLGHNGLTDGTKSWVVRAVVHLLSFPDSFFWLAGGPL